MSTNVLPSLAGLGIDVTRTPVFDTVVQQSISGKETRIARQLYPRYQWDVMFNVLRSAGGYTEYQQLIGFFNARQGQFDTFLYQDADDNAVTGQTIATADSVTTAFQLVRAFGGNVEPVLAPNTVSAVYVNGVSTPSTPLSAPGAPSLSSVAGGSLGATTYYVKVAWQTNNGVTLGGTEASLAVGASNLLKVTQPASPPASAINWLIYVSNTAGGGSNAETYQVGVAIGTTTWTEPTSGLVSGAALPATNTTGWSVSTWGATSPGVITFNGAPYSPYVISADFSYYWPVRMMEDKLAFQQMYSRKYKVKKFSFISVKN
jgi:hypothetical protein